MLKQKQYDIKLKELSKICQENFDIFFVKCIILPLFNTQKENILKLYITTGDIDNNVFIQNVAIKNFIFDI